MIRKTIFAVATVAAIGAAALIPTEASAGGGKGGGMGGGHHWGHGHWGGGFGGIVVIGPSCWRWVPGLGRVYVCYEWTEQRLREEGRSRGARPGFLFVTGRCIRRPGRAQPPRSVRRAR